PRTRTPNAERRTPNRAVASLFLRRKRPVTKSGDVDLALHRVLRFGAAAVGAVEIVPLHVDRELEADVLALHRAGEIGFPELSRVVPRELLTVLLQRDRRRAGAGRRLDVEEPFAGD